MAPGETPREGGKIARDAQGSRWYVSPEFMEENYEEVSNTEAPHYPWHHTESDLRPGKDQLFIDHIKSHLKDGESVICTICGKTVEEIYEKAGRPSGC